MSKWLKRMIPKLKNWRWWVILPYVLFMLVFCLALKLTSEALEFLAGLIDRVNPGNRVNGLSSILIKWSEENDKD